MNSKRREATSVRLQRLVPAAAEDVYAAWTDPSLLGRWMSPVGHAEVTIDVRVGGRFQVVMTDGEVRIEHSGEFVELDPPRRLRFTWTSPYTGTVPSVVTVMLTAEADHTRLDLVHELLPADAVASHTDGWGAMVDRMANLLSAKAGRKVAP
jgi:uncharacterized protein YndB with AHSA1/START domain